jgi:PST family polysaccharide transporter
LAVHIGPSGYAVVGQFQNFVNMMTSAAGGAVNVGVTKYTAEAYDDEAKQIKYWTTAGTVTLVGCLIVGVAITLSGERLASLILKDASYTRIFYWFAAGLVLFAINGLLLAILNGKKDVARYVAANISGSVAGLVVTGSLAYWAGLYGALIALSVNQSIVLVATLWLCSRTTWFRLRYLFGGIDLNALRSLGKYALMTATSAVCIPASQMAVRNHLVSSFGWAAAGNWEALTRISNLYLMVVTTPLAVYYLPRLSEIRDNAELRREIWAGYRLILPVSAFVALFIYLTRRYVVALLFTTAFSPMVELFGWQLLGDTVKIGSWLLGYVLVGRAMTTAFIVTEILFSMSWVMLVHVFTAGFGQQGAQMAYLANYLLHLTVMFGLVFRKIR